MPQHTAIFVATPAELQACFPDMRLALSEPKVREGHNPFTGETLRIEMWDPGTDFDPVDFQDAQGRPFIQSISQPGNHDVWEEQVAPLVKTFPHCALMGLQFQVISDVLVNFPTHAPCYFVSSNCEEWVDVLPVPVAEALANASHETIESVISSISEGLTQEAIESTRDAVQKLQQLAILASRDAGFVCLHGQM